MSDEIFWSTATINGVMFRVHKDHKPQKSIDSGKTWTDMEPSKEHFIYPRCGYLIRHPDGSVEQG